MEVIIGCAANQQNKQTERKWKLVFQERFDRVWFAGPDIPSRADHDNDDRASKQRIWYMHSQGILWK